MLATDSSGVMTISHVASTGSDNVVRATSPTLVTPTLGAATATTIDTGFGANELYDMNQHVQTTDTPQFVGIELNHATANTLTASGGDATIEGNRIFRVGGADVPVADGGTGLSSGTSGGVLAFTASGTLASSGALAANAIVIGGGAGVAPSTTTTGSGVLTAAGNTVNATGGFLTTDGTASPTGKTYDASATGNVLKQTRNLILQRPDYGDGVGAVPQTNTYTASGLMHYTFSGNAETNANYVVYEFDCPADLDTSVAMTARFAFIGGGTDADAYFFHITYNQVAAGAAYPTAGSSVVTLPIGISVTPTTPASGDLQQSAATTLTGWAAALTPGLPMQVRVARLQNTQDDSARDVQLVISYGSTL
jgi:hypothetical protein